MDVKFPQSSDPFDLMNVHDNSVMYWDGALDSVECNSIIKAFESSSEEHFDGSVFVGGSPALNPFLKKNTELNISELADTFKW